MFALEKALEVNFMQLMSSRASDDDLVVKSTHPVPSDQPEVSRGDRLDQFRRQIAALFEVAPDRVDITVRI